MKSLRILIVEDSEDDVELLLRELRRGGYAPEYERVETHQAMYEALSRQTWDIIISDYGMPQFNGLHALQLARQNGRDIPFIILSGTIGEEIAVETMKAGAHDYVMKGNIARLLPAIERELRDVRVRQESRKADEVIHRLAYTDPVTGLPNRIRFRELVQESIAAGLQERHSGALLLLDLDHFKEVNDTLGHDRGDALLMQVGQRMRNAMFDSDVIARLGGDEFGILLARTDNPGDVNDAVKKLHDCLELPFTIDDIPIVVETSIGVAIIPDHGNNVDQLMQCADIAMYRAKQMANDYAVYSHETDPHSHERLGLMAGLRDAIEQNQLVLHFQPKLELKSGRIVGKEALVRWQHPQLGMVPPGKFIIAAEQTGLIWPLTHWVLTDALTHCRDAWHRGIRIVLSVNLSARSLHDPQLPMLIGNVLKETGADPQLLMLEVTESAIVLEPARAGKNLMALSQMGIRISIDDFGTGYTSLSSIKNLPVNEIKIDQSFVTHMLTNRKDAMIVRTIIEFGHNFGLTVVAEGVETKEAMDVLTELGCDEVQGFFISKPLEYEALKSWFASSPYKIGAA
jgi:diguanylate cyclase (GGDEF)-like protein